jgi:hypothetical protein
MTNDVLDPEMRTLLDLGRDALAPDPDTVARLRGKVETTVAAAGVGFGVAALAKGLGAKAVAIKLAVVATVAVVATGTVIHVVHVVRAEREAPIVAPVITPPPELERSEVHPSVAIARPDLPAEAPAAIEAPPPTVIAAPAPRPVPPHPTPRATLARETELVELASHALRDGDLAAVHAAIATYSRETGGAGQLAEDIGAIEVEALCRANDPNASTKLAAFAARWPHAGQSRRLAVACQGGH